MMLEIDQEAVHCARLRETIKIGSKKNVNKTRSLFLQETVSQNIVAQCLSFRGTVFVRTRVSGLL
jgi:hypothetical protein